MSVQDNIQLVSRWFQEVWNEGSSRSARMVSAEVLHSESQHNC